MLDACIEFAYLIKFKKLSFLRCNTSIRNEITIRHLLIKKSLIVHKHDKAGNKYYTQDNTDTRENPNL